MSKNSNDHIDSKSISVLFLAVVVDLLGFGIIIPLLPFWVTIQLNQSAIVFGLILASYSFFQFVFSPIWGRLSDKFGRRPIILLGLTGSFLSTMMLFIGAFYFIDSLVILFIARIFQGTFTAATLPTSQAYISDRAVDSNERTKNFALIGSAFGIGFAIGPGLGGVLTEVAEILLVGKKGYWLPILVASIIALINLVIAVSWLPESLTKAKRAENASKQETSFNIISILNNSSVFILISISALLFLSFSANFSVFVLFGEAIINLTESQAGYIFLTYGIVFMIVQGKLIGPLTKRFEDKNIMLTGLFMAILTFMSMPFVNSLILFIINAIFLAISMSFINPTAASLLARSAPKEYQGSIMGFKEGVSALMRVFGPLIGSTLFTFNIFFPIYFSIVIIIFGFMFGLFYILKIEKKPIETPVISV